MNHRAQHLQGKGLKEGKWQTRNGLQNYLLANYARCATVDFNPSDYVGAGAINTKSEADDLPVSEVFSRPEFMVLGVGRAYPQGWSHRFGGVDIPHVHPADLSSRRMVFETPEGAETMANATTITTPAAAPIGIAPATNANSKIGRVLHGRVNARRYPAATPTTGQLDPIGRQQAIENALSMALYHVRHGGTNQAIRTATAKAIRAASMLKQACTEVANGGRA